MLPLRTDVADRGAHLVTRADPDHERTKLGALTGTRIALSAHEDRLRHVLGKDFPPIPSRADVDLDLMPESCRTVYAVMALAVAEVQIVDQNSLRPRERERD